MPETITQAVAKRNEAEAVIADYSNDFAKVLPSHFKPETFVRLAQGVLRRDPKLGEVARSNPGSFLAALLDCARLGHEPGTDHYHLVVFGNEIQGMEDYKGVIDRIYRAGAVDAVICEAVRTGETFRYRRDITPRPIHSVDWDSDKEPGPLRLVYAYAEMKGGAISPVIVMRKAQVMEHKAASKNKSPDGPWNKWEKSMWLKTAVHELEKWVPSSAEYRREQLRAAAEADTIRRAAPVEPADVVDAAIVEDPS